jgi:ribose/xylose/arabinose/galactoside ABC-type transport system permease subunit
MFYILGTLSFVITDGNEIDLFGHGFAYSLLGGSLGSWPFSAPFLWMIGAALVASAVMGWTSFGNWVYATGSKGGRSAAMIGIPVRRVKITNFVICSTLAGLAGITGAAQYGSVSSGFASGDSLIAIVAVVLGGTSLFGGRGSVQGTVVGAAVVAVLSTGLILVGAPGSWYTGIIGVILVAAVVFDVRVARLGQLLEIARTELRR